MVGDAALGKVVGTDTLGAIAGADQQLARLGDFLVRRGVLAVLQLGGEPGHGLRTVLVLRTLLLTLDHHASGQVRDTNRRVGLVDVLTAGAGGAIGVDTQLGRIDLHCRLLIRLR